MLFAKIKYTKIDIPFELTKELEEYDIEEHRKWEERRKSEESISTVRYSLSDENERVINPASDIRYSIDVNARELNTLKTAVESAPIKTFKDVLIEYIDRSGMKDSEVYKKAQVDRKTFNKIINGKTYHLSKYSAVCLALALELSLDDANELLDSNLSSLNSKYNKIDIIYLYCINNKIYDVFKLNSILYTCGYESILK